MSLSLGLSCVIISALIEGAAHTFFKVAVHRERTARVIAIALGILAFILSMAFYTRALQDLDIVVAYPLDAISFVFVALFARLFLKETINGRRALGILLIAMGAALAIPQ